MLTQKETLKKELADWITKRDLMPVKSWNEGLRNAIDSLIVSLIAQLEELDA